MNKVRDDLCICVRNRICKEHFVSCIWKFILKTQAVVKSLFLFLLWFFIYQNNLLFIFFLFTFIIWIALIVKILFNFSLNVVSIVSYMVTFSFPCLFTFELAFISNFTHHHYLHSSLVKHFWFSEIDDIKSDFFISLHVFNWKVEPLRMSSCICIDSHLKVVFFCVFYFN